MIVGSTLAYIGRAIMTDIEQNLRCVMEVRLLSYASAGKGPQWRKGAGVLARGGAVYGSVETKYMQEKDGKRQATASKSACLEMLPINQLTPA